ncbi:MAG: outer membrane protein transport protein [Candidatus Omnitrophica bacterium]|nr:outer membrane protein transport protein [Candidatus Omnitrophota bacterium]MCM8828442.1 outer membrane protein transport protein [Candidatus Omnitrophota bacterium]
MKIKDMPKRIFLTVLLVTCACFSQGYRNPPAGTLSLMNAGTFAAQADDASACVLNPAGLALLKKSQFHTGTLGLFSETKYSDNTISTKKENNFSLLGNVYIGFVPEKSKLRFGFGITSPYGQQIQWNRQITETFWAYNVPYYGEMRFITITPSMALPVTDNLSIGSGIDIHKSFIETRQSIPWSFITQTPDGTATLKGEDVAASFRIGIHYHKKNHSFGLTWSSPFETNYTGTFSMTNFPATLPVFLQGIEQSVKSKFTIKFPEIYSFGYRWKNEKLAIQLGLESVKYSCLKKIVVDAGPDSFLIPPLIKNWQDVWTYSAGIEYNVNRRCSVNAGIGFVQSPVPDDTFEPTLPDADRFIYTAGTTFSFKAGKISLFYIYNQFKKRTILQGGFTDGVYKSSGSFVGCGYTADI